MSGKPSLRTAGPALLLGILSFLLTIDLRAQREVTRASAGRREDLVAIVEAREERTSDLERRLLTLRAEAEALSVATAEGPLRELRVLTDRIASLAGTTPVKGEGLVVVLSDASSADRLSNDSDSRIQDVDIQAVVNHLWAIGAEAIAVNGQRLVSTSAIRNAGVAVLVNFRVLRSPYRIQAVGNGRLMRATFETSEVASRFRVWADRYGLGFDVSRKRSIELPAFAATVRFRYARSTEGE